MNTPIDRGPPEEKQLGANAERVKRNALRGQLFIKYSKHLKIGNHETAVITSAKANGLNNNPAISAKATIPTLSGSGAEVSKDKVNGLPLGKDLAEENAPIISVKPENGAESKPEENKTAEKAQEQTPGKTELREGLGKPVLNLEGTLKLVEELHRRKIQRDKLLSTIGTLEAFEVAQKDDAEETDSNHYQGCELTIEDDQRRSFSTKNPYIIKKVAEYVNTLCLDKLTEIEGEIFLPA